MGVLRDTDKKKRILYVAPFAHCDGHHCYAACTESEALSKNGAEVLLLTFNGLIDESARPKAVNLEHIVNKDLRPVLSRINSHERIKWLFMFLAAFLTMMKAARIYMNGRYDLIHLRDADPFPFLPRLVGLFSKNTRWIVSVLATLEDVPLAGPSSRFPLWRPVYNASLSNANQYVYVCQNEKVRNYYSDEYLGGILRGNVFELSPIIPDRNSEIPDVTEEIARKRLGLPARKTIFLSFGSIHKGKDPETIFQGVKSLPDVLCLHAGMTTSNMISNFDRLKSQYSSNVTFHDYYIPESEKAYYFAASSAIVLSYTKDFTATSSMLWEACRFRIPIIASESSHLGDLVRSFGLGLTFESQNADSLKETMINFMSLDQDSISTMRKNCDKFCSHFSEEEWTSRCFELYRKLSTRKQISSGEIDSGHVYIMNNDLTQHELV